MVRKYINGEGSVTDLCARYGIPAHATLQKWISLYNANRELRDYDPKMEVYMAEARRKTTLAERKEIVEYCITHNCDYKGRRNACSENKYQKTDHDLRLFEMGKDIRAV